MIIKLNISNLENVGKIDNDKLEKFEEIFEALISSGGLTGVKGGQTRIHFDGDGVFQRVELKYSPWIRRHLDRR